MGCGTWWRRQSDRNKRQRVCGQVHDFRFHLFSWFERHDELLRNTDLATGAWISCLPCSSLFDLEHAKIPQFNPSFPNQGIDDCIKRFLDNDLGLLLRQTDFFRDRSDDVFFGQNLLPAA